MQAGSGLRARWNVRPKLSRSFFGDVAHAMSFCTVTEAAARDIEPQARRTFRPSQSALAVRPGLLTAGGAVQSGTARHNAVSYSDYGCRLSARGDAAWRLP